MCNIKGRNVPPGFYFHFGVANGVARAIHTLSSVIGITTAVKLFININGIPISKGGSSQFWPILGKIARVKNVKPFVISVFLGPKKPTDVNAYLCDFVEEIILLKTNGFVYGESTVFVTIAAFICDRPALAFILCIKAHTAFFSCLKCVTEGVTYRPNPNNNKSNFVVFPQLDAPLRTDAIFRSRSNPHHHSPRKSLLENLLEFDLVDGVLLDGMHLTDLGAMKKLILHYIKGKYERVRMSMANHQTLAHRVSECQEYVPYEFPRKLEPLEFVGSWKATPLRMVKFTLALSYLTMLSVMICFPIFCFFIRP